MGFISFFVTGRGGEETCSSWMRDVEAAERRGGDGRDTRGEVKGEISRRRSQGSRRGSGPVWGGGCVFCLSGVPVVFGSEA